MDLIAKWIIEIFFAPSIKNLLDQFEEFFRESMRAIETEVGASPYEFSSTMVSILRTVSTDVVAPAAGVLLTYLFCYEIISLAMEKNNMVEFELSQLFWVVVRTAVAILLVNSSFDIAIAMIEFGSDLADKTIGSGAGSLFLSLPELGDAVVDSIGDDVGQAIFCFILSTLAWLASFFALAAIYLVVWSRLVMIMIYVSIAPLPFSTLMSKTWLGQIGQNYLKNLMSYALQGMLMVVCVLVYGSLGSMLESKIISQPPGQAIILMVSSMYCCVLALMGCHKLAKSIFAAS
ncbi:MAG: hypothetical protein LBT59_13390 [Clostridiales bacterium]|jgi:hypothetical protein|nr:hypothetical protein [Clostridiales bacterium]